MQEHLDFFQLKETKRDGADLEILVLTQPAEPQKRVSYYVNLVQALEENREQHLPTILIDAGNGQYGTDFHEELTQETELGWLLSYAGFLDMAIVTGTAMSHGVARYAFLQQNWEEIPTTFTLRRWIAMPWHPSWKSEWRKAPKRY